MKRIFKTLKKIFKKIVPFYIFALLVNCSTCQKMSADPLVACLQAAQDTGGLINDKGKDSAHKRMCDRFHREKLVEKWCSVKVLRTDEYGKPVLTKDGKQIFDPAIVYKPAGILLYIETGQTVNLK